MATKTVPEAGGTPSARRDRFSESAPSQVAADVLTPTRLFGFLGAVLAVCGGTVILTSAAYGPRWIPAPVGTLLFLLGLVGLLNHALRDGDSQVRRMYTLLGFVWLVAAALSAVIPKAAAVGAYFLPWGVPLLVLALLFLAAPSRHETDGFWRSLARSTVLVVGVAMAAVGVGVGILRSPPPVGVTTDFLLQYGVILAALGLVYLVTYVGMTDATTGSGYTTAVGLGVFGFVVGVFGLLRGAGPWVLHNFGSLGRPEPYLVPYGVVLVAVGFVYLCVALGILSDNRVIVIARRELSAFFYSPIAYLVLFAVTLVAVVQFGQFMSGFDLDPRTGSASMEEPVVASYLINWIPVVTMLVVVPALTMRLFSEERRSGTLEMLLTAPLGEWSVVLGKFLATLLMFLVVSLPWVGFLVAFRVETGADFDYRPLMAFGIAYAVTGAAFVSMGMFFSSLTRNQIIAAVLTFMGMSMLLMAFLFARAVPNADVRQVINQLSFVTLWFESINGRLYLRDLLLHLSMTAFWLYLTVQVLEARKWS